MDKDLNFRVGSSSSAESFESEPALVTNKKNTHETVLASLLAELRDCQSFTIAVAFVTMSGLAMLKSTLSDLNDRGIQGRLITSTYLDFNSPQVFRELKKIPNLQVRINLQDGFHLKSYSFKRADNYRSYLTGSSNLTETALKINLEWNTLVKRPAASDFSRQMDQSFENLWEESVDLDQDFIDRYQKNYKPLEKTSKLPAELSDSKVEISPNVMQLRALKGLEESRINGFKKALLIAATGTGKTYLSAFDLKKFKPQKFLFVVHREQILRDARATIQRVLGGNAKDYGFYSSLKKEIHKPYLFATIQSLSRDENLLDFAKDHFDYIIIDEAHRAGSESYLKVLDYFTPSFLLGMTATPERNDDYNLFELFDYNIAHEIRLEAALDQGLLTPFHYYGVADYSHEGQVVDEKSPLKELLNEERIDYIVEKMAYYGTSSGRTCGLIFCSSVAEGQSLSHLLNARGYRTCALSASDSISKRTQAVEALEEGQLDYIISRDIFNEGIDIPSINQVVMLRNTESSIVFIQQLGRGLRLSSDKDYVVVLDFIGNYKNNYLIPMALSGHKSSSKDSLRYDLFSSNYTPGLSTVNFEEIARSRIYDSINSAKLDSMKFLRDAYFHLKNRMGRIPRLMDFEHLSEASTFTLATRYDSYPGFLAKLEPTIPHLSFEETSILRFMGRELLAGKSRRELILLGSFLGQDYLTKKEFFELCKTQQVLMDEEIFRTLVKVLDMSFWVSNYAKTYSVPLIDYSELEEMIRPSSSLVRALKNQLFRETFADYLELALYKNRDFDGEKIFTPAKKYDKRDVTRFLNFDHQEVDLAIAGYKIRPDRKKMMIFITMSRIDGLSSTQTLYENKFIGKNRINWFSKAKRSLTSPEIETLLNYEAYGLETYIFIKKSDAEKETSSYFVGQARPLLDTVRECHIPRSNGKVEKAVGIDFEFISPPDDDLFNYLTS
ncbi:DEAD/DEAH box helicase [Streptococcaceae bacterium ESL0729]|nr:DEAD/DEAH box helicase [Streptococcaceae bacterium ESL0729]